MLSRYCEPVEPIAMADRDHQVAAGAGHQPPLDADASFVDSSHLTYLVPAETDLDLKRVFKDADGSARSILDSIPQRDALFFGVRPHPAIGCPFSAPLTRRGLQTRRSISCLPSRCPG